MTNTKPKNRFIEILEIIYAIIFACGIAKMLEKIFENNNKNNIFSVLLIFPVIITISVLIRFFFAPSKNVKILVDKSCEGGSKPWRKLVMPVDIVVLMLHSYFFYMMCLQIKNLEWFYRWFFILLAVNAIWLFSILKRLELTVLVRWLFLKLKRIKNEEMWYMKIWVINNIRCAILYLITLIILYLLNVPKWGIGIIWFIIAFINSWKDLFETYDAYFTSD